MNKDFKVSVLKKFLESVEGKSYSISADKLLKTKTKRVLDEEERTFFCSELVAKAFKTLEILEDDDISCTQFYPHHFSQNGQAFLNLRSEVEIGPELQII